jgi:hypothetical protein
VKAKGEKGVDVKNRSYGMRVDGRQMQVKQLNGNAGKVFYWVRVNEHQKKLDCLDYLVYRTERKK